MQSKVANHIIHNKSGFFSSTTLYHIAHTGWYKKQPNVDMFWLYFMRFSKFHLYLYRNILYSFGSILISYNLFSTRILLFWREPIRLAITKRPMEFLESKLFLERRWIQIIATSYDPVISTTSLTLSFLNFAQQFIWILTIVFLIIN